MKNQVFKIKTMYKDATILLDPSSIPWNENNFERLKNGERPLDNSGNAFYLVQITDNVYEERFCMNLKEKPLDEFEYSFLAHRASVPCIWG